MYPMNAEMFQHTQINKGNTSLQENQKQNLMIISADAAKILGVSTFAYDKTRKQTNLSTN
jgi:hypothetical protein